MRLFDIEQAYAKLLSLLQDEETDQQLVLDTLEGLEVELEDKADNYAKIIKTLESEIAALKQEEERLAARRKSRENNITLLKTNLENALRVSGKTKFKTLLFNFGIVKNGGQAPLKIDVPLNEIPTEYFKERTEKDINLSLVRKQLDEGVATIGHYEARGESLRIK